MIEVIGTKGAAANKALAWGLLLVALVAMILLLAAKPAHAKTFTVNYTGDGPDAVPGNGSCNVVFGLCSLRAAIQETNANDNAPTVDAINFNIPNDPNIPGNEVKSIKPTKALPAINETVTINGYSQPGASPNTLAQGNNATLMIELDGTNASNYTDGLVLGPASSNSVIKGLVINRFSYIGVSVRTSDSKVQGNFIGTDPTGTLDRGNSYGVIINPVSGNSSTSNNQIGGTTPAARNLISGNSSGVQLLSYSSDDTVQGNYIGTKKNGTGDLGNSANGVVIATSGHTVGGNTAAGANVIAFNGSDGVIVGSDSTGNRILRNSIFQNGDLGIDLNQDGVTQNDPKDPDTGANNLQNYPVITSATTSGGTTTIKGKLNSTPNKTFTVRIFSNSGADPPEGKKYIGTKSVTTNANGNTGIFTFTPNQVVPVGELITVTATDPDGNTSEFSAPVTVS